MSFLVDVNNFKCWEDIKSDMNGVYFHTLRIATWKLEVEDGKYVDIIEKKKKRALTRDEEIHLHISSKKNAAGLCRSIFFLRGRDGKIINSTSLLQYTIADKNCDEVVFQVPTHGNTKRGTTPYYPIKKSAMDAMKNDLSKHAPSVAYSKATAIAGGILGAREPGELPRSRQQMYDLKSKMKKN